MITNNFSVLVFSIAALCVLVCRTQSDFTGSCGTLLNWTLNLAKMELTITGKGEMREKCDVSQDLAAQVKIVTIKEGVTTIANNSFQYWRNLTSVSIPNGVKEIKDSAFSWCSNLTSVTIPGSVCAHSVIVPSCHQ